MHWPAFTGCLVAQGLPAGALLVHASPSKVFVKLALLAVQDTRCSAETVPHLRVDLCREQARPERLARRFPPGLSLRALGRQAGRNDKPLDVVSVCGVAEQTLLLYNHNAPFAHQADCVSVGEAIEWTFYRTQSLRSIATTRIVEREGYFGHSGNKPSNETALEGSCGYELRISPLTAAVSRLPLVISNSSGRGNG